MDHLDLLRRSAPPVGVTEARVEAAPVARHIPGDGPGCWRWDGRFTTQGYGHVDCIDSRTGAHVSMVVPRSLSALLVGDLMPGHDIPPRCKVKHCWHPLPLAPLTPPEHRAAHKSK